VGMTDDRYLDTSNPSARMLRKVVTLTREEILMIGKR